MSKSVMRREKAQAFGKIDVVMEALQCAKNRIKEEELEPYSQQIYADLLFAQIELSKVINWLQYKVE